MTILPKIFAAISISMLVACNTLGERGTEEKATGAAPALTLNDIVGAWDVELYFDPEQPPSTTTMIVTGIEDGTVKGSFYGADFESAEAVVHDGYIVFSAITSDGTGPYAHGMRMHAPDHIYGQTLSTGRGFVMPWEAKKRTNDKEEN